MELGLGKRRNGRERGTARLTDRHTENESQNYEAQMSKRPHFIQYNINCIMALKRNNLSFFQIWKSDVAIH